MLTCAPFCSHPQADIQGKVFALLHGFQQLEQEVATWTKGHQSSDTLLWNHLLVLVQEGGSLSIYYKIRLKNLPLVLCHPVSIVVIVDYTNYHVEHNDLIVFVLHLSCAAIG